MKTLICDYYATGEGCTKMILYTNIINPRERFKQIFGEYFLIGVEEFDGLDFDNPVAKVLVTKFVKNMLQKDCSKEYYCSMHYNFS